MRRFILAAPLLAFALLAVTLWLGLQRDPSEIPSVLIDKPLPALSLTPLETGGTPLTNGDFRGKVVLLNVFASWCSACKAEHETLMALSRSKAITLYGLDWKDEPARCAQLLRDEGDPYARVGADEHGAAGLDLGVTGAPETFLIDKKGRIRFKQIGPITAARWRDTIAPLARRLEAET